MQSQVSADAIPRVHGRLSTHGASHGKRSIRRIPLHVSRLPSQWDSRQNTNETKEFRKHATSFRTCRRICMFRCHATC